MPECSRARSGYSRVILFLQRENYGPWLHQLVLNYQTQMDAKDRSFAQFLLNLPSVPPDVLDLLREWCVDEDKCVPLIPVNVHPSDKLHSAIYRTRAGINSLREFVSQRPPLRPAAMKILLELTTHEDRKTRIPAINTVKQWVPDVQPMGDMVRRFALQMLRRLRRRKSVEESKKEAAEGEGKSDDEDGELPQDELVRTEYLPEELAIPAIPSQIVQHVELLLALCVKVPDFLDE